MTMEPACAATVMALTPPKIASATSLAFFIIYPLLDYPIPKVSLAGSGVNVKATHLALFALPSACQRRSVRGSAGRRIRVLVCRRVDDREGIGVLGPRRRDRR